MHQPGLYGSCMEAGNFPDLQDFVDEWYSRPEPRVCKPRSGYQSHLSQPE